MKGHGAQAGSARGSEEFGVVHDSMGAASSKTDTRDFVGVSVAAGLDAGDTLRSEELSVRTPVKRKAVKTNSMSSAYSGVSRDSMAIRAL